MEKKNKKRKRGEKEKMEGASYQRFQRVKIRELKDDYSSIAPMPPWPTPSIAQNGLDTKVEKSRKRMKGRKNRAKKVRGVKKTMAGKVAKKK